MSRIIPIEKTKTEDYGSAEYNNFWLKMDVSQISDFSGDPIELSARDSVICVMSEELDDPMADRLFRLAEHGNRIYILVGLIRKEMEDSLQKRCLIRRGGDITGSFILDANKKSGFFINGQMNGQNRICLELDKEQTEIMYRYFCVCFWQTESDPPIDIFPNYNNFCDSAFIQKMMADKKNSAFVPAILSKIDSSKVITSLTENIDDYVRQVAGSGTRILALKNGNSVHAIENEDGVFIIPKTNIAPDKVSWALKLNETQKNRVKSYLRQIEENADYEFFTSKTRAELAGKDILPLGENDDIRIEHGKQVNLKDHTMAALLPLDDFEAAEPENFADDGRSVKIIYMWRNLPFYLPHGASKHGLFANWENEIKKITAFLDGILQRIDDAEKKESNLAKAISRLFLGKKTKFDSLKNEVNELKDFDFANATNDKLRERITKINEINNSVKNDIEVIDEENRKAMLDEDIAGIKDEIVKKEEQIKTLKENSDEETTKKTKGLEEAKNLLNQLETGKREETAEKVNSAEKPEQGKSEQEKAELGNAEHEKKEKENITMKITALEKEIKVIGNRYRSDINRVEQEIIGLNDKIGQKEREKKKPPAPAAKQKGSLLNELNKNQKNNHSQFGQSVSELKTPDLPFLPKAGTSLWQLNNKVYLAIANWDNFDLGKNEAKRLSAVLCAERS